MPKYRVSAKVVGSKYIGDFEAESVEEAIEMAINSGECCASLCHQCSDECEDPDVTIDEDCVTEIGE